MSLPQDHNKETKRLLKIVSKDIIAKWLLEEGYYPEQYVMPPSFKVNKLVLQTKPYYEVDIISGKSIFEPKKSELVNISFPKSELTDRTFGILAPQIYHDIVWYLHNEWDLIIKTLFNKANKIYSYSFPIPISKKKEGALGNLRSGRMIYEFIEMAENDLVAEAYNYKFILKTDIKNFYPSIYTHSISWALHTKDLIRKKGNRADYTNFLGLKLDKLFQSANDGCTNGIAIGPAISDLISEVILSSVDTACSKIFDSNGLDFIGVRFKDDYRFLCQSKQDANFVIKTLQKQLALFNLSLNESKSQIDELPEGLFRKWTMDYQSFSLRYRKKINFKRFENSIIGALNVDKKHEGTGVIDRFLSELITKENKLKFDFKEKDLLKAISLLLLLKERRNKSYPQILGIIEKIIVDNISNVSTIEKIKSIFETLLNEKLKNIEENQYDLVWLIYFVRSLDLFPITYPKKIKSPFITSLKNNRLNFFKSLPPNIKLFEPIKKPGNNVELLSYLALFKKTNDEKC